LFVKLFIPSSWGLTARNLKKLAFFVSEKDNTRQIGWHELSQKE
jgi:hypothetical protein